MAFFDALKEVEKEDAEVPNHLKDPNRDAESFGHGEAYIYPHAYREHWAAQQYLPAALQGRIFYTPSSSGHEAAIRDEVLRKRELQSAVILDSNTNEIRSEDNEILSWSASSRGREGWFKRLESGRSAQLLSDRNLILNQHEIARHHRILVAAANDGLLLWESLRRTPEGLTAALVDNDGAREVLFRFSASLDHTERPLIATKASLPSPEQAEEFFSCHLFDHILAREPWRRIGNDDRQEIFYDFALAAKKLLAEGGVLSLLQSPPRLGERISRILREECAASAPLFNKLAGAEEEFFGKKPDTGSFRWTWDEKTLEKSFASAGFAVTITPINQSEERLISDKDLFNWFEKEKSTWGAFISQSLGEKDFLKIRDLLENRIKEGPIQWKWKSLLLLAR